MDDTVPSSAGSLIRQSIPCIPLADLPTPVEKVTSDDKHSEAANLWVKRDDLTHSLYGGNKVRKLEFILADMEKEHKNEVVTLGAIGTNHGVATSIFCSQHHKDCTIFMFDQPVTETVEKNYRLMKYFGAKLKYKGSLFRAALGYYLYRIIRPGAYFLPAGGSNVSGCLSFVEAAFELKEQVDSGDVPEPDIIVCPVGSSGTLAGLTLGCRLAGMNTQVIGIRVAPSHLGIIPVCTTGTVKSLMLKTREYLNQQVPEFSGISAPEISLSDEYYGAGYGSPSDAGKAAGEWFGSVGIGLESTYTEKAAAAVMDICREHPEKKVLYWHTFNSADTEAICSE